MTLTAESFTGRVLAVLSRRSPAFRPPTPAAEQQGTPSGNPATTTSPAIAPNHPSRPGPTEPPATTSNPKTTAQHVIAAMPPTRRLALRTHPAAHAIIHTTLVDRALGLALDLTSALGLALDLERALGQARHHARDLTSALDFDLTSALGLERALGHDLTSVLALARTHDPALAGALASVLALSSARERERALERTHDLASTLASGIADGIDPASALEGTSALAGGIAGALDRNLALSRILVQACAQVLDVTLTEPYRLTAVHDTLASALADGMLDDVTNADLSHTNLTRTDLTGLRWTLHSTRWPPEIDTAQLLAESVETPPGSGIYTITSGPEITARDTVGV